MIASPSAFFEKAPPVFVVLAPTLAFHLQSVRSPEREGASIRLHDAFQHALLALRRAGEVDR